MKDLKYLLAYLIPILVYLGFYLGGYYTFLAVGFAFVFVPIFESFLPQSKSNLSKLEVTNKLNNYLFDVLLYLNIPMVFGAIFYFLFWSTSTDYKNLELIGNLFSVGTLLGANGINVAHELGHRFKKYEQFMSQFLLMPSLYMHFFIEHNMGHHKHVGTKEDPSTARFNESIYFFWIRSTFQSYVNAWKLESFKLNRDGNNFWSAHNRMIGFTILQLIYLTLIYIMFSWYGLALATMVAVFSFLLLETINYIEHYGLVRNKNSKGRYERVKPTHSWNSNHYLGRIVLYELTRHSDHHYIASKKYQILDHHEDALQLPFGYPAAMLISLVPPLWFTIMNPLIQEKQHQQILPAS